MPRHQIHHLLNLPPPNCIKHDDSFVALSNTLKTIEDVSDHQLPIDRLYIPSVYTHNKNYLPL